MFVDSEAGFFFGLRFLVVFLILPGRLWNDSFKRVTIASLIEKPPIVQLLKNIPAFYGTRRFITVFTRSLPYCCFQIIRMHSPFRSVSCEVSVDKTSLTELMNSIVIPSLYPNLICHKYRPIRRSKWPRGLRHELSSPAQTLGSWVRIPLRAWIYMCVYPVFVLSCVQVAALRRADPPSKESYQLCKRSRNCKKSGKGTTKGSRAIDR
jgi:hypothetical protein